VELLELNFPAASHIIEYKPAIIFNIIFIVIFMQLEHSFMQKWCQITLWYLFNYMWMHIQFSMHSHNWLRPK